MQWFRFYGDALNDPKVQSLDGDTFKVWVNLLCVTSQCDGHIIFDDISFHLRMSDADALSYCIKLADKGLLIPTERGYRPNGWEKFQYKSDTSAERTRAYRDKKANAKCDASVTSHVTPPDTDTETDKRKKEPPISPKGDFDALWKFWNPYDMPKGSKKDASDAYAKALQKNSHEQIMSQAEKYLSECHLLKTKTKHLSRWIKKLEIDDGPDTASQEEYMKAEALLLLYPNDKSLKMIIEKYEAKHGKN